MTDRSRYSFRTKALLSSFAFQSLFVAAFSIGLLLFVADRGERALRDNLGAAAAGYARNAAFVFISSLEGNRTEFLAAAGQSPNIEAAFMTDTDFRVVALTNESWRSVIDASRPSTQPNAGGAVVDFGTNWIFFEPVFADARQCDELAAEPCGSPGELLGYVGIVGNKKLIRDFARNVTFAVLAAAVLLLACIYLVTNHLAETLYRPMRTLIDQTRRTADADYREKIAFVGPPEVEDVAQAINHLIDRAATKAGELERQVAEKTREEREARAVAEDARALAEQVKEWRTELMAVNTHELLTPLRLLVGHLDMAAKEIRFLEDGKTTERIAQRLHAMEEPIGQMRKIIGQLNIAMQIEERRIEVLPHTQMLDAMVQRILSTYEPAANEAGVSLIVKNGVHGAVTTDHRMLETIVDNLVSNACKFTRKGEIHLTVGRQGAVLEIICCDTGVGIADDKKALLFEPLYQADMSPSRTAGGLGLGLSIVKGYVEKLGGDIRLESALCVGTTVTVRLPLSDITSIREVVTVEAASSEAAPPDGERASPPL